MLTLPLIQGGQLSVTGERMWHSVLVTRLPRNSVGRLTDRCCMIEMLFRRP